MEAGLCKAALCGAEAHNAANGCAEAGGRLNRENRKCCVSPAGTTTCGQSNQAGMEGDGWGDDMRRAAFNQRTALQ